MHLTHCDYSLRVQDLEHENMMQTQSIQSLTQEIEQMRLDNVKVILLSKMFSIYFRIFSFTRKSNSCKTTGQVQTAAAPATIQILSTMTKPDANTRVNTKISSTLLQNFQNRRNKESMLRSRQLTSFRSIWGSLFLATK